MLIEKLKNSSSIWTLARILLCGFIGYWIIQKLEFVQLRDLFVDVKYRYALFILLLLLLQNLIKAVRWHILLKAKGFDIAIIKIFRVDYVSTFLSLFFPSSISVEIFKSYGISKGRANKEESLSSIIADRAISLFSLLFLANVGLLLFFNMTENIKLVGLTLMMLIMFTSFIGLLASDLSIRWLAYFEKKIAKFKIVQKIFSLVQSFVSYKNHRSAVVTAFFLSSLIQLSRVYIYYLGSLALGVEIPLKYFFAYVPSIMLIVMLPISLAGIGVREGSFIYFFTDLGISASTAFAIPFLVSILVIVSVLPGGLLYAMKGLALKHQTVYEKNEAVNAGQAL